MEFLLFSDDLGLEQRKRSESKEEEDNDGGSAHLCSSSRFRRCDAKMALQVDITPGSYKAGPPTAGALVSYDPHFKMEETEWLSKERGNTRITGILIYIEYS
ncbi:Uncharacterized protein FKW44_019643 [Caligus rogercresseyi]|uniref:Uncharacterized protein n=1 Tax=Caligus rogercresseyi TaxID=217165 RepID=A0A7T8GWW7_CALRO|nr:Uncharacterized protein FKW44_019643 [Caligus rogercresseyi]